MNCSKFGTRSLLRLISGISLLISPLMAFAGSVPDNSIAMNPKLPGDAISWYFGTQNWPRIKNLPYDSYVIFRGRVMKDRTIKINQVWECQADEAHLNMAEALASKMESNAAPIGSHIQPTVEVYVVFYESCCNPNRALVFSEATAVAAPSTSTGGDRYMRIFTYDKEILDENVIEKE